MSHKSEKACPFNKGDNIIYKHFTFTCIYKRERISKSCLLRLGDTSYFATCALLDGICIDTFLSEKNAAYLLFKQLLLNHI